MADDKNSSPFFVLAAVASKELAGQQGVWQIEGRENPPDGALKIRSVGVTSKAVPFRSVYTPKASGLFLTRTVPSSDKQVETYWVCAKNPESGYYEGIPIAVSDALDLANVIGNRLVSDLIAWDAFNKKPAFSDDPTTTIRKILKEEAQDRLKIAQTPEAQEEAQKAVALQEREDAPEPEISAPAKSGKPEKAKSAKKAKVKLPKAKETKSTTLPVQEVEFKPPTLEERLSRFATRASALQEIRALVSKYNITQGEIDVRPSLGASEAKWRWDADSGRMVPCQGGEDDGARRLVERVLSDPGAPPLNQIVAMVENEATTGL